MRKIDVFTHISPPGYSEGVERIAGGLKDIGKRTRGVPMLHDLDVRFRVMEKFPEYQQVLSLPTPPIELYATPDQAVDLARIANDSMAELVEKYPEHFVAFAAKLMRQILVDYARRKRAQKRAGAAPIVSLDSVSSDEVPAACDHSPDILALDRALEEEGRRSRIVLQVHDEIVLEVPQDEREAVVELTVVTMTSAFKLNVPLEVNIALGPNWADAKS